MTTAAAQPVSIARLPGPRTAPLVGNLHQLDLPRLHQQLERWAAEYGPIYRIALGRRQRVCVSDLDTINTMLRERPDTFRRTRHIETIMDEMGFNGVFSRDGEAWRRQRKVVAHALNPAHLAQFYPAMRETTERLRRRWAGTQGTALEVCRELMRYTVDVTAHLAFGIDVNTIETDGPVVQQQLDRVFPMLFRRTVAPFPYWRYLKTPADRELDRALAAIRTTVVDFTERCRERMRAEPGLFAQPTNFLEAILAAQAEEAVDFSDDEIYANVITLMLAGEDTTANTLAWACKFLVDFPQHFARARAEADAVLGADTVAADLDAIRRLDFIEALAHETMRHKPVAPILGVEPKVDIELLGCHLPAGTEILALTRPNAMSDDHFAAAERFEPGRWLRADGGEEPHNPRAFMPFGAGPRFCPGRGLAMLEIKAVLAMLVRNFDIALATPGRDVREQLNFTMLPEGLALRFAART
ncbi:MAG: cytochrome P450 [Gammaproteobacteria bacterium]|nr:cytochrome P450 [Gammaproteobacteria bacterium]MCP5201032.1 cytochrome P450 [Gammaproteobacteria bacterium]